MILFANGRRLYTAASILTLLVAGMHTIGNLQPTPPEFEGTISAMRGEEGKRCLNSSATSLASPPLPAITCVSASMMSARSA